MVCPIFNISNGHFKYRYNTSQAHTVHTRVEVHCSTGYGPIEGVGITECSESGVWLPIAPGCDSKFKLISHIACNGLVG